MGAVSGGGGRWCGLALAILLMPLGTAGSAAVEGGNPVDFCAFAQGVIAQTSLLPRVDNHSDRDSFIDSKPTDLPFVVHQFYSSHLGDARESTPPSVVSCKMRTSERINAAHSSGESNSPPAGVESSCHAIHHAMLNEAYLKVPPQEQVLSRDMWLIEAEELTFIGPKWLEPWPFVPVSSQGKGGLVLRTRGLYVPFSWWIPMPDRFLGNYYCHLVAPAYLEALLRGEAEAPLDK